MTRSVVRTVEVERYEIDLLTRYYRVKEWMPKILHDAGHSHLWLAGDYDPWGDRVKLTWEEFELLIAGLEVEHGVRRQAQRAETSTGVSPSARDKRNAG